MERIVIDFTELPRCYLTNDAWILVMVDHFTSFVWADSFPTKSTVPVCLAIMKIVAERGSIVLVASDNGKEFVSKCIKACNAYSLLFL